MTADEPTPDAQPAHSTDSGTTPGLVAATPTGEAVEEQQRRGLIGSVIGRVAPTVLNAIDLDQVIDAIDVDAVAQRLDLDALVQRLDVNAVAEQLDLDALILRLDLDTLVQRLDVDAIAAQLDLNALVGRIDMTELTAGASQEFAQSGLDLARRQLIRADAAVESFVDRTLLRRADPRPAAPEWMQDVDDLPAAAELVPPAPTGGRRSVSGHYAGAVTRVLTVALDMTAAFGSYALVAAAVTYLLDTFLPSDWTLDVPAVVPAVLAGTWLVLWLWLPLAFFGRTPAMALVGLAALDGTGAAVGSGRALVRALVEPVAAALALIALIGFVLGRQRRGLHDLVAGTIVVYDWGARQAEQPTTLRGYLSARMRRVDPRTGPTEEPAAT